MLKHGDTKKEEEGSEILQMIIVKDFIPQKYHSYVESLLPQDSDEQQVKLVENIFNYKEEKLKNRFALIFQDESVAVKFQNEFEARMRQWVTRGEYMRYKNILMVQAFSQFVYIYVFNLRKHFKYLPECVLCHKYDPNELKFFKKLSFRIRWQGYQKQSEYST